MSYFYEEIPDLPLPELKNECPWLADRIHRLRSQCFHYWDHWTTKFSEKWKRSTTEEQQLIRVLRENVVEEKETVLPGFAYVAISWMTGTVLVRRRSLPVRWTVPPALGLIAFSYCFPKTYQKASNYVLQKSPTGRRAKEFVSEKETQMSETIKEYADRTKTTVQNVFDRKKPSS
ncbi:hypothetical protein SJAG_02501 [Schizosaccharomyces japonicus yFS275]|uniref:MICOS complex subunit n=1 Tax=Schizosaccharomyces japonicus (strain yFS275 / FY16936) TaxID=402676 RepID=B6K2N4_SCHJY|nr:hypothetical protein SJAG_02501 [Schizosaccharomyces japonicus yFS275]EEB07415.1 hypothetical protein SJAG_02501 [Schizosaccharomyces japonicus yFS275]